MRIAAMLVLVALAAGCENKDKLSAQQAPPALDHVMPLLERDVEQVRGGLPKGAEALGKLLDEDPSNDPAGLRRAIEKARAGVLDLAIAKSTFFVFVSPDGVVQRSEADPDLAAGQSLVHEVPEARAFFAAPAKPLIELFGSVNGLRGVEKGGDLQWIVGSQIHAKSGKLLGAFVTGWSFRRYVEYLEGDLRRHLQGPDQDHKVTPPLSYLFLVRGDKAYGGPVTPDVDADAVAKLDLSSRVGDGPFQSRVEIEGRRFAVVARRTPALDGVVVALLLAVV